MKYSFFHYLLLGFLAIGLSACIDDEEVIFTAQEPSEEIEFLNDFSSVYLLSSETQSNTAERLVWNEVDFGVPTAVNYILEGSIDNVNFEEVSTTTDNNYAISVGKLLEFAEELGLDDDPLTTDVDGNPNNEGVVFLRLIAVAGDGMSANSPEKVSEVLELTIVVVERQDGVETLANMEVSIIGLVGDSINDFGNDGLDLVLFTRGDGVSYATINNPGEGSQFKLRENNDWSVNYGAGETPGSITPGGFDNNFVFPAGDILLVVVDLNTSSISVTSAESWGIAGDVINDFGGAGPDIRLTQDPEQPGLWFALGVAFEEGQTKFRLNNDWANNWGPDPNDDTILIQGSFNNFQVLSQTYDVFLDLRNTDAVMGGFVEPGSLEDLFTN